MRFTVPSRCVAVLFFLASLPLSAADRVALLPSGGDDEIVFLDAATLTPVGSTSAPAGAFAIAQSADGRKFYIVTARSQQSIVVLDAQTLLPRRTLDLGASPSRAVLTPDGRYLLIAAGAVRVIDTATDTELGAGIPVGGGASEIVVDDTSRRAYVLAASGNQVQVLRLADFTIEATLETRSASSIALTSDGARLVAATRDGLRQFRVRDFEAIEDIPGNFSLVNATVRPLEDPNLVLVENRGVRPANTSQIFNLNSKEVRNVGDVGATELRQVIVVDAERAVAVDADTNRVVEIDLTASSPSLTPLPLEIGFNNIAVSPNRRALIASSLTQSAVARVNLVSGMVEAEAATATPPTDLVALFGPSTRPADAMTRNGGDAQFFPPGTTLPIPLSVLIVDDQGVPLPNVPVIFEDVQETGLIFEESQPRLTNLRGIASVRVTLPPTPPVEEGEEDEESPPAPAEPIEPVTVAASSAGVNAVLFDVNVIRAVGMIKISGDNQVVETNSLFPKPLVLLATDGEGRPLPGGTIIELGPFFATCNPSQRPLDVDGFARIPCVGGQFSSFSSQLFEPGTLAVSIPELAPDLGQVLTRATFTFSVARNGTTVGLEKIGGDGQTGRTGEALANPLEFRLTTNFGSTPGDVTVEFTQISGPPVLISRRRVLTRPGRIVPERVEVTLGPNAGTAVVQAEASVPGLPKITYTINMTGGQPTRIEAEGDGQSGRILRTLSAPLRVSVINETGGAVQFPQVNWQVIEGDATIEVIPQAGASLALVTFGATPGPVRVQAAIGGLQRIFNLTATAPVPSSISTFGGQGQTLTTGLLSEPLTVTVLESDGMPAAGAMVTFAGPPNVRLQSLDGAAAGNPLQAVADLDGRASIRAELVAGGLTGGPPAQIGRTITITATAEGNLSTSFLLGISGRTPQVPTAGIVNAAVNTLGGLVPGSLVSIFGTGLMEGIIGVEEPAGADSFAGVTVRIGGVAAPLLALASTAGGEQINLQVPFEVVPNQTTTVEIENNGSRGTIGGVAVFQVQPAIFEVPVASGGTVGAVIHVDGRLVSPAAPAERGEALAVFWTGGGRVDPPVATGVLGPVQPSLTTQPVIVGVANMGSELLFSGYAPGFLGLYQSNFVVPEDAPCGDEQALRVRIGDSISPASTIALQCP